MSPPPLSLLPGPGLADGRVADPQASLSQPLRASPAWPWAPLFVLYPLPGLMPLPKRWAPPARPVPLSRPYDPSPCPTPPPFALSPSPGLRPPSPLFLPLPALGPVPGPGPPRGLAEAKLLDLGQPAEAPGQRCAGKALACAPPPAIGLQAAGRREPFPGRYFGPFCELRGRGAAALRLSLLIMGARCMEIINSAAALRAGAQDLAFPPRGGGGVRARFSAAPTPARRLYERSGQVQSLVPCGSWARPRTPPPPPAAQTWGWRLRGVPRGRGPVAPGPA